MDDLSGKRAKLLRYNHKDYSEVVDFPVEIVGRDGVIRRYAFEDAIRLYQRRVTFASIRYRDPDLIRAEVEHCRNRIDQLRRSFFFRFGWGTPSGETHPEEVFGDLAGELAAFLRRVLRCDGRLDVRLDVLEEDSDGVSTWYVVPAGQPSGLLLYAHRFPTEGREAAIERFFTSLEHLVRASSGVEGDGERLLSFHQTADCGFLLTGQADQGEALASVGDDDGVIRDVSPTEWDRLLDQVRLGQYADAFATSRRVVQEQPMHRRAYILGACLASHLGQHAEAEEMALLGGLWFQHDPDIGLWLGLARWRQNDLRGAAEALSAVVLRHPSASMARFVLAVVRLEQGQWARAMRVLHGYAGPSEDRRSERLIYALARAARMFGVAVVAGLVMSFAGLWLATLAGVLALIPVVLGAVFGVLAIVAFRHELRRVMERQRLDDVGTWVRRVIRQEPQRAMPM